MPLYEYRCEKCGELFEVRQKFTDEPLNQHEKCGGHVERLVSAPTFHFKGSGWYVTDYAKSDKSGSNGGSGNADGAGKDSGSANKDATPAASTSSEKAGTSDTKSTSETKSS